MTAEILKPFGEYHTDGPNPHVIELLEEALELARKGECVGVAVSMLNPSGFTKNRAFRGSRGWGELVGAVVVMQDDIIRKWKQED